MKRKITDIILVIILLVGVGLVLYPTLSEYINSKHQSRAISQYNDATKNLTNDEYEEKIAEAKDYNVRLKNTPDSFYKPSLVSGYEEVLDITGTGIMGYVSIPRIKVELPIYHGVADEVLQFAAGHLEGTSFPVGGEGTHAVLSGHRGLPSARLFTDLDELEVGDTFYISILNQTLTYQVDQIRIVLPYEVEYLQPVPGNDYVTLMTCTPYGVNTHRLLVRGVRIENEKEATLGYISNDYHIIDPIIVMPVVATPLLIIWLILTFIRVKNRRHKKLLKEKGVLPNEEESSDT